jgi:hypothetical protein
MVKQSISESMIENEPSTIEPQQQTEGAPPRAGFLAQFLHLYLSSEPVGRLWRWLNQPWLLWVSGGVVLAMIVASRLLPQLPGQLNDEPATAARWLLAASAEYGSLGALLAGLGLFNVLHSPLLRVLLAIVGLILLIHLAEQTGIALGIRSVQTALNKPSGSNGEPLPLASYFPIYRRRLVHGELPPEVSEALREYLARCCDRVDRAIPQIAPQQANHEDGNDGPPTLLQEERVLALRHIRAAILRPLLSLGLLVLLIAAWLMATFGWQVTSPVLAPGESFHSPAHDLQFTYQPTSGSHAQATVATPVVQIKVGGETTTQAVAKIAHARLGAVNVRVEPGPPALLAATSSGEEVLARPGQSRTAAAVGLIFPTPGSEDSVLLPALSIGLRIVRQSDGPGFLVEFYRGDGVQPIQRVDIQRAGLQQVEIPGSALVLQITPLPGLQIEARRLPGTWLVWPALILVVAGLFGVWRRPVFALAQIALWPDHRALVILQSNSKLDIAAIAEHLHQRSKFED